MKQSALTSSNSKRSALFASATEDELIVSQILLGLGNIIAKSESQRSKFTWVVKKRRSSLDEGASCSRVPSSSDQGGEGEIQQRPPHIKAGNGSAATASPDNPFSFLPSEFDDDDKHSLKKKSKKQSRKQYNDMLERLTQRRDCLRGEVDNVREYYDKLKAENSQLKAKKQKVLKTCLREEDPQMERNREMNHGMESAQNYGIAMVSHQQPLVGDQMLHRFGPITTHLNGPGPGPVNHVGPFGIPDLNILPEEVFGVELYQQLDMNAALADRRARFIEARRLRRGIIKIKAMRSACGITW